MGNATPAGPSKLDVARALLLKGTAFVHLDPRREDVVVPSGFRNQPQLVLQVGIDMPVPIRDLRVDEHGVVATLSFNRTPFTCTVPWTSVFALVGDDGRGMVWAESMPVEVAAEVEREVERMAIRSAEAEQRAEASGQARAEVPLSVLAIDSSEGAAPARERRRATRAASKKHQPSAERVPRGVKRKPIFGVIAGEGGSSPSPRGLRIGRPSHLKLVK